MSLRRNVLIFHSGALGDFILSWPLAMALGRLFAQSRIFYVTSRQKGLLAERALRVESLDVESGWHGLFSESPQLPPTAERMLAGAHAVAGFVAEPDSIWMRNVQAIAAGAEVLTLAAHPPADFTGHHTDFLLQQLAPAMVWQQGTDQMLRAIRQRGLGLSRPALDPATQPVVLHPGAGSPAKCWPIERFIELASRLRASGQAIQFVLGEVERERWPQTQIAALSAVAEVCQTDTLTELLDLLNRASAFIGNDSGPGHLAGMLGLPTISLFGPTDAVRWQPVGPRVKVLANEPLSELPVGAIESALAAMT